MIRPTIGRKVWFYEAPGEPEQDATVIDVHGDRMVSLFVVSRGGFQSSRRSIPLLQDDDKALEGPHCAWMPYQVGQAKAHAPKTSTEPGEEEPAPSRLPFPAYAPSDTQIPQGVDAT